MLIYIEMELFRLEFNASSLHTTCPKLLCKTVKCHYFFGILTLISILSRIWSRLTCSVDNTIIFQQLLCFLICITPIRLNNRMHYAIRLHVCIVVKVENTTESKLLFIRTKRTNEITKTLRKHRNGTVYKVNRRSTLLCFTVNDIAFLYIMRYISYVYTHFPQPIFDFTDRQSIIKILCITWVNGTCPHVTEVLSLCKILWSDLCTYLLCSLLHTLWILIR